MAPPIFLGSFKGNFRSPVDVVIWVVENVPCTRGPVPEEWTHGIYAKLRQSHVDPAVIVAGLKLARGVGYDFESKSESTVPVYTGSPLLGPAVKMDVPGESPREARKHAAEVLEYQFEKAKLNGNYGEMKRIAQQFADLLNKADPGSIEEEEMQWGAPLLRQAVRRNADGSDPAPTEGGQRTWGRGLYVPVPGMEGEGEAEAE